MTLLRRRPREVYRVYTEEEYLNGAELEPAMVLAGRWPVEVESARNGAGERRLRRVAGMAMLAGAVGTVGGVVAANNPWAHRGAGRRPGSLVAEARSPRIVRSISDSDPASAPPPVSTLARPPEITRSRAARHRGASRTSPNRHSVHLHAGRRGGSDTHPRGGVAVVVDYSPDASAGGAAAPSASAGETTAAVSSADEATTPVSASAATVRAGTGTQAEFGFER